MKIYMLSGGVLEADRSVIHPGDDSHRRVSLPIPQLLIQADGKNILVDTGCPPEAAGDDTALQRERGINPQWISPHIAAHERPDRQLEKLNLSPSDLDFVINTHMHFDHAGGNSLFVGVPVYVQAAELSAMQNSTIQNPWWDAPGLQFHTVQGDWSPVDRVEMLLTPGHSPGHQSMLVRTAGRPWLFTWDAVYTEEHWRENKLGAGADPAAARTSMDRLRQVAEEENAHVIFGHDLAQFEALGMGHEPLLILDD